MTDAEKLREIAIVLDQDGFHHRRAKELRRIADLLDSIPPETLKALADKTWKAVPVEPTEDMLEEIAWAEINGRKAYREMLAAAPEKPE